MRWLVRAGALLLVTGGVIALWSHSRRARENSDLPTAVAKQGEFAVLVNCRGSLRAARKVSLQAPVNVSDLQIIWLASAGSAVKAGDAVIRFDASKLQQDLLEKTQALKQAQASLDQAQAQARIDADKDHLDLAQSRADMEKAELEASKKAIVSAIQGDESAIDYRVARQKVNVQLSTADLHKESNGAKIASLKRLRDQAQAELDMVKSRLSLIQVRTPSAGVITYMTNTTQGWMNAQNYKVGDHAYPGATIAEIPDLDSLEMESKVDEDDRGRINVGDDVTVYVDAFPEQKMKARLASISPLTEQSFEEWPPTRSFRAYASLVHPDARLRPGMNAAAGIVERKLQNVITVPARAIFTVDGKPTVYAKTDRSFAPVQVTVKGRNPDEVAIDGIRSNTTVALLQPSGVTQ